MRRSPLLPLLLAVALALTACGARLDPDTRRAAADGALESTRVPGASGTGDIASPLTGGAPAGGAAGAAIGSGAGDSVSRPGGGVPDPAGAGASGVKGSAGGSGAAAAPPGGNGGATDVGVTADTITLGNVSDLSGPVPGLFQGAVIGTQAYLAKVNAAGGVFGRKLKLRVGDGQLDCDQNRAQNRALKDKVFAFVGSFSLYDGCGATVLKNSGIADVHNSLSQASLQLANNFSVAPLPPGWRSGPLTYYKQKYGDRFKNIGTVYANAGGADATWRATKQAIEAQGGNVAYERGFSPTDTDFTADIVSMQRAGVKMIYISASDAPTFARVVQAARQQSVDWPLIHGAIAYDSGFIPRAGKQSEGVVGDQQFALFFNKEEAANIPAVAEFQKWTATVAPGEKTDLFGVFGWSSAQLFVQALTAAGPKAKRADVLRELSKITSFDADGMLATANPAGKKPATCWILTVVKNGRFVRVETPGKYRCDGGFFVAKAS